MVGDSTKSQTLTSKCNYGTCDGSGVIIDKDSIASFCKCREDMILAKKLDFANIPEEFKELKVGQFQTEWYSSEESKVKARGAKKAATNFVENYDLFKEKGKGLYLYSYIKGSGKTRLAASLANALVNIHKARVRFITTLDLLDEIKATYNRESAMSENDLINAIKEVDVLVLDDIGVEEPTSWVKEKLYNILNGRMISNKITIFTSNSTVEELKHDDRIKNRIEKMAVEIYLPDESIRSAIAKKESSELQDILFK